MPVILRLPLPASNVDESGKAVSGPVDTPSDLFFGRKKIASLFDPFENTFTLFQLKGVITVLFVRENVG